MVITEQINLYIGALPEWQRKAIVRMRQLVHAANEQVEEAWQEERPHFRAERVFLSLSAEENEVHAHFPKGAFIKDKGSLLTAGKAARVYVLKHGQELDEAAFADLVKQAIQLDMGDAKAKSAPRSPKKSVAVPAELLAVLKKDGQAWEHWEALSASHKKEFSVWVSDAPQEETRKRRIARAFEMIREGKDTEALHGA
jgi:hypothetical protein